MDQFTSAELTELLAQAGDVCVSIMMPTFRSGPDVQQNPVRLKNLLRQAETKLAEHGCRGPAARKILDVAAQRADDPAFWAHPGDGLALFVSPQRTRAFHLPQGLTEAIVVGPRFHVQPLLPLVAANGRFFVLAVGQKDVRFLQCTRDRFAAVDVPNLPHSLDEALNERDEQRQFQFRKTAGTQRQRTALFPGHGEDVHEAKERLHRYFRRLDEALHPLLRDERAPLVLAAVEYYFPIYQEANTYAHFVQHGIHGNPELLNDEELHRQAWEILRPVFEQEYRDALTKYHERVGAGQTAKDISAILAAAYQGRVESLFLAQGAAFHGTFDPTTLKVEITNGNGNGDDLVDLAVMQTLSHRGAVYLSPPAPMPEQVPIAAVMRY